MTREMIRSSDAFGINPAAIIGPGRTRSEPSAFGHFSKSTTPRGEHKKISWGATATFCRVR